MEEILVDTNILLRSIEPGHPSHLRAVNSIVSLLSDGHRLCVLPQNLIEFWNVATRPIGQNGLGRSVEATDLEVTRLEAVFAILPDTPSIYYEWRKMVRDHSVRGKNVHDARIVAAMTVHRVEKLLTFNGRDFERFPDVTLIDPFSIETATGEVDQ